MKKMAKIKTSKAFSLIELSIVILTIGLLIAGITKGHSLYLKSKLVAAQKVSQYYQVQLERVDEMAFWYDALNEKSFNSNEIVDGGKISALYDTNPNATSPLNVAQTNDAIQPLYSKSAINGLPAIHFDLNSSGTKRTLLKTGVNSYSLAKNGKEMTLFAIQNVGLERATFLIKWHATDGSQKRIIPATPHAGNKKIYFDFGTCCVTNARHEFSISSIPQLTSGPALVTLQRNANTGNSVIRINGEEIANANGYTNTLGNRNATFSLGDPVGGYIGELMMYKIALSTQEIELIEKYLAQKWGIALVN